MNTLTIVPYRYMMLIDGEDKIYFIDRDNSVFKVEGLTFPRRKEPDQHISNTLLDGVMFFLIIRYSKRC